MKKRLTDDIIYSLYEEYNTPSHVIAHCKGVCDTAMKIGKALVDKGVNLDLDLIYGAAMAHDVARTSPDHGMVIGKRLEEMGYFDESKITKIHMTYDGFTQIDKINETDIVCLGDRTVKEDKYVGIDQRIEYIIDKAGRKPDITTRILEKKAETIRFINKIENIVGKTLDEIVLG